MLIGVFLFPLFASLGILMIPKGQTGLIRQTAWWGTLMGLIMALLVFLRFDSQVEGFQMAFNIPWVKSLGIGLSFGVDGINVGLILMGALVAFAAVAVSDEIQTRIKEYYFLLTFMTAGILGAFASLDLFFFYIFHEFALVPTFIMIGVWGHGERKDYAAFKMTLYLTLGALLALIGLIGVYVQVGAGSFNLVDMLEHVQSNPVPDSAQKVLFPFLLFGFGILVSLWPFHTWAPMGYAAAPTATAMLHAGVLKKFGLYGLIRIGIPFLPEGARVWMEFLAILCLGNLVFCGWVAMRQKDLNGLIANSSVAHMGFVFLGIATMGWIGISGAVMVMVAHGLLAGLSFALSGYLRKRAGTLEMEKLGGLLSTLPFWGTALMMALLAGCGVPGFANFAGEMMVLFGAWEVFPWITVAACWAALIIGGVYMIRAIRVILHGKSNESLKSVTDLVRPLDRLPYVLLLAGLLVFGFFPRLLLDKITPSVKSLVASVEEINTRFLAQSETGEP